MIVDRVNQYLTSLRTSNGSEFDFSSAAQWIFKRQFIDAEKESEKGVLRLSSSGKCARQQAYGFHGFERNGKEINSRSKIVFFTGDVTEAMIISLAKLAGCEITHSGKDQKEVSILNVLGHPDGFLHEKDGTYLIEVKSMSSFSFKKFERGELDESYLAQINMYLEGTGLLKCVVVALNKDSGVLGELIIEKDPEIVEKTKKNLETVLASSPSRLPDRAYEPNKNGELPWQCRYCSFYGICWPEAEKVLKGNAYILKVKEKNGNLKAVGKGKLELHQAG